ncbi:unnamed protein product [Protopolystoma xenopodis]|uniref:Uncharacterized protein n=1 Tax=Protopolystoma xenopodis TaxID=117903 RepID=A0A3S5CTV6_9PLAT|nr:unnamed protein product [Protopolystoma xenopodis]
MEKETLGEVAIIYPVFSFWVRAESKTLEEPKLENEASRLTNIGVSGRPEAGIPADALGSSFELEAESNVSLAAEQLRRDLMIQGRYFTSSTTLLVRVPFPMDKQAFVEFDVRLDAQDGTLIHFRASPDHRERLTVKNIQDHQFTLALNQARLELKYVDGRLPQRTLQVRTRWTLAIPGLHRIQAGVYKGHPWVRLLDKDRKELAAAGLRDIEEIWTMGALQRIPTVGGPGTMVIGHQIVVSPRR